MKKLVALLILISLLIFAACSSKESETPDQQTPQNNEQQTPQSNDQQDNEQNTQQDPSYGDIAAKAKDQQSYYYELIASSNGTVVGNYKIWSQNGRMKYQSMMDDSIIFIYSDEQAFFIYNKDENTVTKMPVSTMNDEFTSPFVMLKEFKESDYQQIDYKGQETIDSKDCSVFEFTGIGVKVRHYIWKDEGILIKVEVESQEGDMEYYFKDLEIGGDLTQEISLPTDAEVIDIFAPQ